MKGTTIRLGFSGRFLQFFKKNGVTLAFASVLTAGFICGVISSANENEPFYSIYNMLFNAFINSRIGNSFARIFLISSAVSVLFVLVSFLSGLSLGGIPLLAVVSFIKGFVLGIPGGLAVARYSFKGFVFYLVIVLLPGLISSLAVVLSCREASNFSAYLLKSFTAGSKGGLMADFRIYCLRYLVILAVVILSAVADMLLSSFFAVSFGFV